VSRTGHPRGYVAAWSAIGGGALALIVFQAVHHDAPGGGQAAPRPSSSASGAGSGSAPVVSLPVTASPHGTGTFRIAGESQPARPSSSPSSTPSSSPSPAPSSPSPTPSPAGAVGVSAAVVVPLRGSTPVAVRASLAIPGAPPFPLLGLDLALALP
jgi:hypothetical protein